jgi:hypothetical protein
MGKKNKAGGDISPHMEIEKSISGVKRCKNKFCPNYDEWAAITQTGCNKYSRDDLYGVNDFRTCPQFKSYNMWLDRYISDLENGNYGSLLGCFRTGKLMSVVSDMDEYERESKKMVAKIKNRKVKK